MKPWSQRDRGIRLIIVYKLVKAVVMFALALVVTFEPAAVLAWAQGLAHQLGESRTTWAHLGKWIDSHLSRGVIANGTVLVWLDAVTTAVEGLLLLSGRAWAEWIVVAGMAGLIPLELRALIRR